MPVTLAAMSRPAKRMIAFDTAEGAMAPGSQTSSVDVMASGFLMPGRMTGVLSP